MEARANGAWTTPAERRRLSAASPTGKHSRGRVDEEDNAEYRSAMDTDVEISMWGAPLWRVACVACVSASVYDVCVFVCA